MRPLDRILFCLIYVINEWNVFGTTACFSYHQGRPFFGQITPQSTTIEGQRCGQGIHEWQRCDSSATKSMIRLNEGIMCYRVGSARINIVIMIIEHFIFHRSSPFHNNYNNKFTKLLSDCALVLRGFGLDSWAVRGGYRSRSRSSELWFWLWPVRSPVCRRALG